MHNPYEAPRSPLPSEKPRKKKAKGQGMATASLVLGLVSIITWIIPLFGLPTTIAGLVFGLQGLGPKKRTTAAVGIALSSLFLVITILNAALGAYMAFKGTHPLVQQR
jgi:hypothetical protein